MRQLGTTTATGTTGATGDPNAANNVRTRSVTVAAAAAVNPTGIPTLSQWGLVILSALMGLLMLGVHRRRMP